MVLICSSLTVAIALASLKQGRPRLSKIFLSVSLGLGLVFLGVKGGEWNDEFGRAGDIPL